MIKPALRQKPGGEKIQTPEHEARVAPSRRTALALARNGRKFFGSDRAVVHLGFGALCFSRDDPARAINKDVFPFVQ